MKHILCTTLVLLLALSSLSVEAQPKDKDKKLPTPPTLPTPAPLPEPPTLNSPPQSSGKGDFSLSWGTVAKKEREDDEKRPPAPGTVRITWGEAKEESSGGLFGGLGGKRSGFIVRVFVRVGVVFKKLPLIRRIDFDLRKAQVEKKKAERTAEKAKK